MDIPAPTADQGRDELGRPTAPLSWWRLLAVTAYWLAITVLWGAFTFSVIPRLVESKGVLGSSTHPLAGLAIGVVTTAGVLIAILVQPTMGAISDYTRTRQWRTAVATGKMTGPRIITSGPPVDGRPSRDRKSVV